jgi:hypothetical protein
VAAASMSRTARKWAELSPACSGGHGLSKRKAGYLFGYAAGARDGGGKGWEGGIRLTAGEARLPLSGAQYGLVSARPTGPSLGRTKAFLILGCIKPGSTSMSAQQLENMAHQN